MHKGDTQPNTAAYSRTNTSAVGKPNTSAYFATDIFTYSNLPGDTWVHVPSRYGGTYAIL